MVPPEQPLALNVELLPEFIVEGLALNDGAAGVEQPLHYPQHIIYPGDNFRHRCRLCE